jgi:predicted nucleic acid-binding protein
VKGGAAPDIDAVADELYGLAPSDFTAARDLRAREARQAGQRAQATAIKGLRRPTGGAWLANLLVRERPDQLTQLLELGAAMRAAQAQLAGDELRRLSGQRHRAVSALAREAVELARRGGRTVSDSTGLELAETLEAALADAAAADAVRTGRLTHALRYSGLGPVDVPAEAVAPASAPPSDPEGTGATSDPDGRTDGPARTAARLHEVAAAEQRVRDEVEAAEQRVRDEVAAAAEVHRAAAAHERVVGEARDRLEKRQRRVVELEEQLDADRAAADRAAAELRHAEAALDIARSAGREADDRVDAARGQLDERRRNGPEPVRDRL